MYESFSYSTFLSLRNYEQFGNIEKILFAIWINISQQTTYNLAIIYGSQADGLEVSHDCFHTPNRSFFIPVFISWFL